MTSCVGIYASAMLEQVVKSPTYSPGCAILFDFIVVYNVSKLFPVSLVMRTCEALPLVVGGLQRAIKPERCLLSTIVLAPCGLRDRK